MKTKEYVVVMVSSQKLDNDFFVKVVELDPAKTKVSSSNMYNFAHFSKVMSYHEATEGASSFIADGFFVTILNVRTTGNAYDACASMLDLLNSFNSTKNALYEDEDDEENEAGDYTSVEASEPRKLKIHRGPCPNPQEGMMLEPVRL